MQKSEIFIDYSHFSRHVYYQAVCMHYADTLRAATADHRIVSSQLQQFCTNSAAAPAVQEGGGRMQL